MKKMERQRRKTKIYKHIHEGTHNCYMNTELMQLQSHQSQPRMDEAMTPSQFPIEKYNPSTAHSENQN
jgi:hypothetical protein